MFLKISPDLDMPLTYLDIKNHYPKFKGLGDMAIVISETQIPFFGTPRIYIYIYLYIYKWQKSQFPISNDE